MGAYSDMKRLFRRLDFHMPCDDFDLLRLSKMLRHPKARKAARSLLESDLTGAAARDLRRLLERAEEGERLSQEFRAIVRS